MEHSKWCIYVAVQRNPSPKCYADVQSGDRASSASTALHNKRIFQNFTKILYSKNIHFAAIQNEQKPAIQNEQKLAIQNEQKPTIQNVQIPTLSNGTVI